MGDIGYALDNERGYDQAVIKGIIRRYVCGYCYGPINAGYHPSPFTFSVRCADIDCPGNSIISKAYLEAIERNTIIQTDELQSNLDDYDKFMKELEEQFNESD